MWSQVQDWRTSGSCLDDDSECAVKRHIREDFKLTRTPDSTSEFNQVRSPPLVFFDARSKGIAANAIKNGE
jgi:hypothetical protein